MLQIKNTLGGGKSEGLYAWTKNTLSLAEKSTTSGQEAIHSSTATKKSVNVYYSTEYTFDTSTGIYTLVNPSVVTVSYGSQTLISDSKYAMFESPSGSVMYKATGSFYLRNNTSGLSLMTDSTYKIYVYGSETTKTFIDYVVSDKETAYPDGGEKGGYWYEKVSDGITPEMYGCTKMAIDTVTFASDTNFSITGFSHSLGEIPKQVFIYAQSDITAHDYAGYIISCDVRRRPTKTETKTWRTYISSDGAYGSETRTATLTAETIKINGGMLKAGVEYKVVTMA